MENVIEMLLVLGGSGVVFALAIAVLSGYADKPLHELSNSQIAAVLLCIMAASFCAILFASIVAYAVMQVTPISV